MGPSGGFLHNIYIDALDLQSLADVYLTNAVRCRPPGNATPKDAQVRACRPHLLEDVRLLQSEYESVTLFCVGASAVRSILGTTLTPSFGNQGTTQEWGWAGTEGLRPCPVFTTYHPAMLLSKRNPSKIAAIRDHLRLLHSHLSGVAPVAADLPTPVICPPVPRYPISRLSLDIETYGAVATCPPQTCFHPVKSAHFDRPRNLIATAALCWRDPSGELRNAAFNWSIASHRDRFISFLRHVSPDGEFLGMNIKFDILNLLAADPRVRLHLHPGRRLVDLSVLNYLHSEQRPERSLKSIAPLLRIARYDEATSLKHHRYPSGDDPALLAYNVKDTIVTLLAIEELERRIAADYPTSPKWSEYSRRWYSRLLWTCLSMEEAGIAFDTTKLDQLDFATVLKAALLYSESSTRWNVILSGKGSDKSKLELFLGAVEEAGLLNDDRLEKTDTKPVSVNRKNAALLLESLDPSSPTSLKIRKQQEFEGLQKIVTAYTRPMLHGNDKNPVASRLCPSPMTGTLARPDVGIAYPSWFAVPSSFDSGHDGGTLQGRITSKGPACQTLPAIVKTCLTSRYQGGFLMCVDLSQIELRIAALLSGDPAMLAEYNLAKPDLHSKTALVIAQKILDTMDSTGATSILLNAIDYTRDEIAAFVTAPNPRVYPKFDLVRQMGKTGNFLIIYRGSATKLRATIADDLGVILPLETCSSIVEEAFIKYPGVRTYQDALIETAKTTGRIELPFIGQSRMFIGSRRTIEETFVNEIVNFPIQSTAANVMLDIQHNLMLRLNARRRKTYVGLNIYDSVFLDGPASELPAVSRIVDEVFSRSEYFDRLCEHLGRSVRLGFESKLLVKPHTCKLVTSRV